ncbi:hypothetical protein FOA52_014753 [Chlamydomonas sp. UWO 241]|nr:hypothetical protein FOA52_014753 [Chlamydomonas sp. UWO 241]
MQSRRTAFLVLAQKQQPPSGGVNKGLGILEWTGKVVPQGLLVGGVKEAWKAAWQVMVRELAPQDRSGAYVRQTYAFDAKAQDVVPEPGRYHLYLGNACPWCHRVYLAYVLRGFSKETLGITQLGSDPTKARRGGWIFSRAHPDPVFGAQDLWEVYDRCQPGWTGRCTAPLLVDKIARKIVSNESADIVAILDGLPMPRCSEVLLRPESMAKEIDALCEQVYRDVNNGVYVSGFSTSQVAYDAAQTRLFSTLDMLEERLSRSRFLLGDRFTQADLWLFPTISRFDSVYAGIFRCGRKLVRADYPNLQAWLRDVWQLQVPGSGLQVPDTIDIDAARSSYYGSLFPVNPSGIVAAGPTQADLRLGQAAGRGAPGVAAACHMRVAAAAGA